MADRAQLEARAAAMGRQLLESAPTGWRTVLQMPHRYYPGLHASPWHNAVAAAAVAAAAGHDSSAAVPGFSQQLQPLFALLREAAPVLRKKHRRLRRQRLLQADEDYIQHVNITRPVRATGGVTVNSMHTTHTVSILQSDVTSVGFFIVGSGLQLDGTVLWVTDFLNVTNSLGFILYLAEQCYSIMIKKRRQGPSFVGEISTPAWWSKKLSDKHRCWEALVERGPTETMQFHDRLIVLYMLVVIYLLPLLLVLHRSDASGVGIVVPGVSIWFCWLPWLQLVQMG
eukprot:SAG22_NODE_2301_length_2738_cov_7.070860_2_plen_284_part_00